MVLDVISQDETLSIGVFGFFLVLSILFLIIFIVKMSFSVFSNSGNGKIGGSIIFLILAVISFVIAFFSDRIVPSHRNDSWNTVSTNENRKS